MVRIYNEEKSQDGFLALKRVGSDIELVIVDSNGENYNGSSTVLYIDDAGRLHRCFGVSETAANAAGLNINSHGEIIED